MPDLLAFPVDIKLKSEHKVFEVGKTYNLIWCQIGLKKLASLLLKYMPVRG